MNTTPRPLSGLVPVMLTPFTAAGAVDRDALDALTDWYLANGAGGLFACCQSSEIEHLGWGERLAVARRVVQRVDGRVAVVAAGTLGLGDLAGEAAALRALAATGVDVAVAITGHVVPQTADDLEATTLLERLADLTPGVPLGLYECPRPYKRLLSPAMVARLAASGRWRYLKDTACDAQITAAKIRAAAGSRLRIFDACAATFAGTLAAGGDGLSPILANLVPDLVARLCATRDPQLASALTALGAQVEIGYPQAVKEALALAGLPMTATCRTASGPAPAGHGALLAQRAAELRARFAGTQPVGVEVTAGVAS